ncbi:MAG: type IX secretion system sortase PorU [Bacteroidetes bacterium]|nr:type IX secretion system sortase PorU [Bacteroidota bacterium]
MAFNGISPFMIRIRINPAFLFMAFCITAARAQSPIASGTWLKLRIQKEGVYKITYTDLKTAGFPVDASDPRNWKMMGPQGAMLPEENTGTGYMQEVAIEVIGESDGKFDPSDYILFYGQSTGRWVWEGGTYRHRTHLYSDDAYLYLGEGTGAGKRLSAQSTMPATAGMVTDRAQYLWYHDSDISNPAGMGRIWLGAKMGNETLKRTITVNTPVGISDTVTLRTAVAARMKDGSGNLQVSAIAGTNVTNLSIPLGAVNTDSEDFRPDYREIMIRIASGVLNMQYQLTRPNSESSAWIDYIELIGTMPALFGSESVMYRNMTAAAFSGNTECRISGTGFRVWNVSNPFAAMELQTGSGSGYTYFRTDAAAKNSAFALFTPGTALKPEMKGLVSNQNLAGSTAVDFVIISDPTLLSTAQKIAALRATRQGLQVLVTTPEDIYKEYNAGVQDIAAIRQFLRHIYKRSAGSAHPLKYALLLGSASFDYKDKTHGNTNMVPIYQSASHAKAANFCLDDFYGYLDSSSGNPQTGNHKLTISIGRIPARTLAEAEAVYNKLKRYGDPESLGPWRSLLTFIADDVDESWEAMFTKDSEDFSSDIDNTHPDMEVSKVFADAYKQVSTGNTEKFPEVSAAIDRTMNNGSLFTNYMGHGGEKGWAQEAFLTVPMIRAWKNPYKQPILFTATCEFSRYDNPELQSGGELALLNPEGGAVALMSTTRLVYASGNSQINADFWTNYGFPKPNEPLPVLGDLFKTMKNRPSITSEDNKFALLGDPSMPVAFPEHSIVIDSVNGKATQSAADTLKAFSVARLKGHIDQRLGGKFNSFNGNLWVKVLDKPQVRYTLANDGQSAPLKFTEQNSVIYKGMVSVVNGDFTIVFPVPKDIAYNIGLGKILMYAHNGSTDAAGALKLKVGGSETNLKPDIKGPVVRLYMNDTTFRYGGSVEPDADFLARVYDENGLNTTGAGIGRDITATLDPGTPAEQTVLLNDYFNYDLNSFTLGTVRFPFAGLTSGDHTIRFRIWDIYNNSGESTLRFHVTGKNIFTVEKHYPMPNPFHETTQIVLEHNLAGEELDADLEITDLQGRIIMKQHFGLPQSMARETRLSWDGRNAQGAELPAGLYIYRVLLKCSDGRRETVSGRVVRQ